MWIDESSTGYEQNDGVETTLGDIIEFVRRCHERGYKDDVVVDISDGRLLATNTITYP